jgi:hypothetical protein
VELDAKNAKNPKITNFFSILPTMIYPKTVFCVLICVLKLHLSQLPTVSEPNADTDIVVVHTISEEKKNRENASTGGGPFK